MAKQKPTPAAPVKTVAVTALRYHTKDGAEHQPGHTYQAPESDVASLVANGFAAPTAVKATTPARRAVRAKAKTRKK